MSQKTHTMTTTEERIYKFAQRYRDAARHEAVGMGSATPAAAEAHDQAKAEFLAALSGIPAKTAAALILEAIDSRWRETER
jgi:hypothetical protein